MCWWEGNPEGFHNTEWAKGGGFGKHLLKGWAAPCHPTSCILPWKNREQPADFGQGHELSQRWNTGLWDPGLTHHNFPCSCVPLTADTGSETRSTFVSSEAFLSNACQLQQLLTEHTAQNPLSKWGHEKGEQQLYQVTHFMFMWLLSKWN